MTNKNKPDYTPEMITGHEDWWTDEDIFVFGSNDLGRHGAGAAKTARLQMGAVYGQSRGLQGQSYAIVTISFKNDPNINLDSIGRELDDFVKFANTNYQLTFWMTKIGTNLAGYTIDDIAELFKTRDFPDNVKLPIEFS